MNKDEKKIIEDSKHKETSFLEMTHFDNPSLPNIFDIPSCNFGGDAKIDEAINNIIKETKCFSCIHAPVCFAQKGGVDLQLASGMGCQYYQAKIAEDEIVIKKSEYKELKKYRTDWLNDEKMHLQAELEDTEFELGCSNRLFQKVCEEKKELEEQLERYKNKAKHYYNECKLYGGACYIDNDLEDNNE